MILSENFRVAFAAIRANKMRSVLTTLGIIIGVAAVIAVVSVVQGLQFMMNQEFQGVGATYLFVFPDTEQRGGHGVVLSRQVKLTWQDGLAIEDQVPGIKMITPMVMGSEVIKYRDRSHRPEAIAGVNEDYPEVVNHTVDRGRFISRIDLQHRRKVVEIGRAHV